MAAHNTNVAEVIGTIENINISHEVNGIKNYFVTLKSFRSNGNTFDLIPMLVREDLINEYNVGDKVQAIGTIRSYNIYNENEDRVNLKIYIVPKSIRKTDKQDMCIVNVSGIITSVREPRKTPSGREIKDALINVFDGKKMSKLPIIIWEANLSKDIQKGDTYLVYGRLQSREYIKNDQTKLPMRYPFIL